MKTIIDIPYIFQRLETLLLMASLTEEATSVEQSFKTLESIRLPATSLGTAVFSRSYWRLYLKLATE